MWKSARGRHGNGGGHDLPKDNALRRPRVVESGPSMANAIVRTSVFRARGIFSPVPLNWTHLTRYWHYVASPQHHASPIAHGLFFPSLTHGSTGKPNSKNDCCKMQAEMHGKQQEGPLQRR